MATAIVPAGDMLAVVVLVLVIIFVRKRQKDHSRWSQLVIREVSKGD
jgi:hypothetical protein